jgi:L-rhamnose mutarotase
MTTRTVLTVDLKDDKAAVESYKAHHLRVWPEVLSSLRRAGIRDMDIYILDRRLVMVVETDGADFRQCFATYLASDPTVAEWEALMRSILAPPPGAPPGEWWTSMDPVFNLQRAVDAAHSPQPTRGH